MFCIPSVEAIEQQLLDEAEHAAAPVVYARRREALARAEKQNAQFPCPDNLAIVNDQRRRLRAAHRALFRVVG